MDRWSTTQNSSAIFVASGIDSLLGESFSESATLGLLKALKVT
jgi:hypothetical protein